MVGPISKTQDILSREMDVKLCSNYHLQISIGEQSFCFIFRLEFIEKLVIFLTFHIPYCIFFLEPRYYYLLR